MTRACGDGRVLKACGRDELNSNGRRLLAFASDNKLATTNEDVLAHRNVEHIIRPAAFISGRSD